MSAPAIASLACGQEANLENMDAINDRIRIRAYELSSLRGFAPGHEDEDWFQAEREILDALAPNGDGGSMPVEA